jgi:hypothetical protein
VDLLIFIGENGSVVQKMDQPQLYVCLCCDLASC